MSQKTFLRHEAERSARAALLRTSEQAAEALQCTVSWLEDQARLRRIPFSMIGGSYRFSDRHLEQIIAIFEETPKAEAPAVIAPRRRKESATPEVTQLIARRPRRAQTSQTPA